MSASRASGRVFLEVEGLESAYAKLLSRARLIPVAVESVALEAALGRYIARDVFAGEDAPSFRRSTVDGYAVRSSDVALAGDSIPAISRLVGSVDIGSAPAFPVGVGECAEVPTGGMVPDGADAVVMLEYAEDVGAGLVALQSGAAFGENVVSVGEEIKRGDALLRSGRRLSPRDIGSLAAGGFASVPVFARPRMAVISTGAEIVPPDQSPPLGKVRDVNSALLSSMAIACGYALASASLLSEGKDELVSALRGSFASCDIIVVSGGSSKGPADSARDAMREACSQGALVDGIAMQPGKPTLIGYDEASRTVVAVLPGHPVSAMTAFELLFARLIRELFGVPNPMPIPARLTANAPSSPGRLTCRPASLKWNGDHYEATPVFAKSGLISRLASADGYFLVDRDSEGLREGDAVLVRPY